MWAYYLVLTYNLKDITNLDYTFLRFILYNSKSLSRIVLIEKWIEIALLFIKYQSIVLSLIIPKNKQKIINSFSLNLEVNIIGTIYILLNMIYIYMILMLSESFMFCTLNSQLYLCFLTIYYCIISFYLKIDF